MSVEENCSFSRETPDWAMGLKPCDLYNEGYTYRQSERAAE